MLSTILQKDWNYKCLVSFWINLRIWVPKTIQLLRNTAAITQSCGTGVFLRILRNFKNSFSYRIPPVAVSENNVDQKRADNFLIVFKLNWKQSISYSLLYAGSVALLHWTINFSVQFQILSTKRYFWF